MALFYHLSLKNCKIQWKVPTGYCDLHITYLFLFQPKLRIYAASWRINLQLTFKSKFCLKIRFLSFALGIERKSAAVPFLTGSSNFFSLRYKHTA